MVLVTSQVLFSNPPLPMPPGVSRTGGILARATGNAIRRRLTLSPIAFVRRAALPLVALEIAGMAWDVWSEWAQQELYIPNDSPNPVNMTPGALYNVAFEYEYRPTFGGPNLIVARGFTGDQVNSAIQVTAPISQFFDHSTYMDGTNERHRFTLVAADRTVVINDEFVRDYEFLGVTRTGIVPVTVGASEAFVPPFTQPSPQPAVAPPAIVPITVPLPRIPRFLPSPYPQPMFLPEPYRLPTTPIPVIPGTPENPEREAFPVPIWVVPGGLEIGVPGGGISISIPVGLPRLTPELAGEIERERVPPRVGQCLETPRPPDDDCTCEEIREIVIEELDNKFPPKRPTVRRMQETSCKQSGVIALPPFTERVRIIICDKAVNTREQSGVNAPNVVYAGWYAFGDGAGGDRNPIHYEDMTVYPPHAASSISYTMYTGNTARLVIEYVEEAE